MLPINPQSVPVSVSENMAENMADKMKKLYVRGYNILNPFQKEILKECIAKGSGGLSLPMGSGKTLLSIVMALFFASQDPDPDDLEGPIVVIASKSLIMSWAYELNKFFGDDLPFEVVHMDYMRGRKIKGPKVRKDSKGRDKGKGEAVPSASVAEMREETVDTWKLKPTTMLVLTTADVVGKAYKESHLSSRFIFQRPIMTARGHFFGYANRYVRPTKPFLSNNIGLGQMYSLRWSCMIVDEVQMYTNISTQRCQGLGALCAKHRWALSGTMFDEPKDERILGYHVILDVPDMPRELELTSRLIRSKAYKGLDTTLVQRSKNAAFTQQPTVNETVVQHQLSEPEKKIYLTMRKILVEVKRRADRAKFLRNKEELKLFTSYKLVMLLYLRQALICPLVPITSILISASDLESKSELAEIMVDALSKAGLDEWMNDVSSIRSTRMNETIKCVEKHPNERVIIFTTFKTFLDIFEYLSKDWDRPVLRMSSNMSLKKRGDLIREFERTTNGVLLLTYQLGANGLNLQCASVVALVDFWWNSGKTKQAIARIFRYGQKALEIFVYFFTANTGVEEIIFKKQKAKQNMLEELKTGATKTKIPKMNIDHIIRLIEEADYNLGLLNSIYKT